MEMVIPGGLSMGIIGLGSEFSLYLIISSEARRPQVDTRTASC